jgi:hypothetical protein
MNDHEDAKPGLGEARTRQRQRRYLLYCSFSGLAGGVVGFMIAVFDRGDGNLFSSEWDKFAFDPPVAILLAGLLLFGFALLPLYDFRTINEVKREHNLIQFTGGCIAVLAGFPIWTVLHAGGIGAAPQPFGVWLLAFVGMIISYLYAKWRM